MTFFDSFRFAWVMSVPMRSLTRLALTGSSSLTSTFTVGCEGFSDASDSRSLMKSLGRIRAARTSPDWTICRACSSLETSMQSIREQSSPRALVTSSCCPLITSGVPAGISLRNATRGFSGPRESAKPISTAIAIG